MGTGEARVQEATQEEHILMGFRQEADSVGVIAPKGTAMTPSVIKTKTTAAAFARVD